MKKLVSLIALVLCITLAVSPLTASATYTNVTPTNTLKVCDVNAFPITHKNTGYAPRDLTEIAYSQVGYKRNEGTVTKYGQYTGASTGPWCCSFILYVAHEAGIPESVIKKTASCLALSTFFKDSGRWRDSSSYIPKEGDIAFFQSAGSWRTDHVGIVSGVVGNTLYTIEGNHDNSVALVARNLNDSYIIGYGVPNYNTYARVAYTTHVQGIGWIDATFSGVSGTTGEARRMEAFLVLLQSNIPGSIEFRSHVQTYGWLPWQTSNTVSGTTGESKRIEAVEIRLTGEIANMYDIYYRIHVQSIGWMDWCKNGQTAGTTGQALRAEAIDIKILPKGVTP